MARSRATEHRAGPKTSMCHSFCPLEDTRGSEVDKVGSSMRSMLRDPRNREGGLSQAKISLQGLLTPLGPVHDAPTHLTPSARSEGSTRKTPRGRHVVTADGMCTPPNGHKSCVANLVTYMLQDGGS